MLAAHAPRQNHLLAALPPEDYERLLPDLEHVPLPLGWTVYQPGERPKYMYFITAGFVSWLHVTQQGASTEAAVIGNEGVIGLGLLLSGTTMPGKAVVVSAGHAYRLSAAVLNQEIERVGPLMQGLLRYTQAMIALTGQTAVCNRHHSLEQRLCLWILLCLDRSPSNELAMTQELIADMLGVRRGGVTEAAGKLQRAGLVHYSRGHISVLDRSGLEAQACECYAVIRREYECLLGPENALRQRGRERYGWPPRFASAMG